VSESKQATDCPACCAQRRLYPSGVVRQRSIAPGGVRSLALRRSHCRPRADARTQVRGGALEELAAALPAVPRQMGVQTVAPWSKAPGQAVEGLSHGKEKVYLFDSAGQRPLPSSVEGLCVCWIAGLSSPPHRRAYVRGLPSRIGTSARVRVGWRLIRVRGRCGSWWR
jgi:hypothetical protein